MNESINKRRQKFEKTAALRVQQVLNSLDTLEKCANRTYHYDAADLKKIDKAVKTKLKSVLASFAQNMDEFEDKKNDGFSF